MTPSLASNSAFDPVAQPRDRGNVRLDDRGQLRRGLQRLDHPLRDDLPGRDSRSVVPRSVDGAGDGRRLRLPLPRAAAACSRRDCGLTAGGAALQRWRLGRLRPAAAGPARRAGAAAPRRHGAAWPRRAHPACGSGRRLRSPVIEPRSTSCSAASFLTRGVTYGLSAAVRSGWRWRLAACDVLLGLGWPGTQAAGIRPAGAVSACAAW